MSAHSSPSSSSFAHEKIAFVSGLSGSTLTHVNIVSSVALSSIALYASLITRKRLARITSTFPVAWTILVLPLLLSMTLFASAPGLLTALLVIPTALSALFVGPVDNKNSLPSTQAPRDSTSAASVQSTHTSSTTSAKPIAPLPALTTYRAHMMLMTILAILAVDFPVFPRELAKCETFGVSLMDIGVGSFVFSQGVVSAIPLIKDPRHLTGAILPKLRIAIRKSLPVLALGLVRVLLVKGTEYPEHESEYGTHWNFFITLGLLPALQVLMHPLIKSMPISLLAVVIGIGQQFALSFMGGQVYVLDAPRTTLMSANKEGIVSLSGYLAIHLLGLSLGTVILPPSPSYFRHQQQALSKPQKRRDSTNATISGDSDGGEEKFNQRQNDKTATELCSYAVLWWVFLLVVRWSGVEVSRRMANLPYILWVSAYNTSFLLGYLILDLIFFPSPLSTSIYSPISKLKVTPDKLQRNFPIPVEQSNTTQQRGNGNPPELLEALNKNGLVVFLLANVATGIVNMSIRTVRASDCFAMVVLSAYALGVTGIAWFIRGRRVWKM